MFTSKISEEKEEGTILSLTNFLRINCTSKNFQEKKKNVNTVDWPKIPRKSNMSFQKEVGKRKRDIKRDKVFRG